MPLDERVLVIPETHFRAVGYFEGFQTAGEDFAHCLLDATHFSFRARSNVETDPSFKQLIPYVILTCGDRVFHYRRGAKGTETRLQSLRSIGIGGHISEADAAGDGDPYAIGLERELAEEVATPAILRRELLGFIYDPATPVGRVHLGVVHRFELTKPDASARDAALIESGFAPLAALRQAKLEFESWSQLALDQLSK
jgi:predicted NUDIX family phosphoesterase